MNGPKAKRIREIADLTPDPANVNRGTERGHYQLDWSLTELGAGFQHVDCFWRWMNFAGWIAIKE